MIGERVGDWAIDSQLGQDTRGRTFQAHLIDDPNRQVTIRILPNKPEVHEIFRGRLSVLRKLSHPNLIAYLAGGIVHADPYFVTETPPGPSYEELLRDGKRPAWPEVLAVGLQCVSALRHAHRRGVLHGDLRPGNIYRATDGQIKIAECGIARLFGAEVAPPGENPLASAAFISPEQAAGKTPTKRSDFYSLGCLLYALVACRPPFAAATLVELIHKHCFVMPERPAHFQTDLPDEFDALIMKLLAKDPQVRPGSGTHLLAEFERVWASLEARGKIGKRPTLPPDDPAPVPIEEEPEPDAKPIVVPEYPPRPIMRRPYVVIPLFLLVVAATIAGFYLTRSDPDDLWAQAQPLMRSDDPADWDRAWEEYLEPLSRRHPDRYADEIKAFRARTEPAAELRRAIAAGRAVKPGSEAERFYYEGVKLCQAGDFAGARREWERVVAAFSGVESESRWVELARQAASRVPQQDGALQRPSSAESIRTAIARAKALRAEGKTAEADTVLDALETLYRDDPDGTAIREMIAKAR
jgi:serine/threonine protein kinase